MAATLVLGAMGLCGCTTSWMWLEIRNETDRPVHAMLTGRECVLTTDIAPGQAAKLEGYDLTGEVVAGANRFPVGGMRNSVAKWKIIGQGEQTEAKVDYGR